MTNSPIPDVVARLRGLSDEMFSSNLTRDHHPVLPHRFHIHEAADLIEALHFDVGKYKSRFETVFAEKEALQRELAARDDTISLLESNARVQATLLADTGRALEEAKRAASLDCDVTGGAHVITKQGAYTFCVRCGESVKSPSLVERARDAESQASSARRRALEALSISIYRVEDENDIVLRVFGQIVAEWDQNSLEAVSILKLAAAIRDINGAGDA